MRRLSPFFVLYLCLMTMLTLGEGGALALFVKQVGAEKLPLYYGITAPITFAIVVFYIWFAERLANTTLFRLILYMSLLLFGVGALLIYGRTYWDNILHFHLINELAYGSLIVGRELSFSLILIHFGSYLQDFFKRDELIRYTSFIYSGGRFGGILGGGIVLLLSSGVGLLHFIDLYFVLGLTCFVLLAIISHHRKPKGLIADQKILIQQQEQDAGPTEISAPTMQSFWEYFKQSKLFLWVSMSTFFFILCRWALNFEYNRFFESYFPTAEAMGRFLGTYTMVAMAVGIVIQLLVIHRILDKLGVGKTFLTYGFVVLTGFMGFLVFPSIVTAVACRFIESELRLSYRNPVSILISNSFDRLHRKRARAFSLGLIIPLATLVASGLLLYLHSIPILLVIFQGAIVLLHLWSVYGTVHAYQVAEEDERE